MPAGQPLTLLWPAERGNVASSRLADEAITDLELDTVIGAIVGTEAPSGRLVARERFARQVLMELLWQPEVIAHRQAVLSDLLDCPDLRQSLEGVLPALEALGEVQHGGRYTPHVPPSLERVARRLADLELL